MKILFICVFKFIFFSWINIYLLHNISIFYWKNVHYTIYSEACFFPPPTSFSLSHLLLHRTPWAFILSLQNNNKNNKIMCACFDKQVDFSWSQSYLSHFEDLKSDDFGFKFFIIMLYSWWEHKLGNSVPNTNSTCQR